MKIYELEGDVPSEDPSKGAQRIVETIQRDCTQILSVYQAARKVFYRGVHGNSQAVIVKNIRTDRKAVGGEAEQEKHNVLVNWMIEKGYHSHRGNSIFCTGNQNVAYDWGSPYVVFPVDGWYANWTQGISETTYSYHKYHELWWEARQDARENGFTVEGAYKALLNHSLKQNPIIDTNDISKVANYLSENPYEIMFAGSSYIGVLAAPTVSANKILTSQIFSALNLSFY